VKPSKSSTSILLKSQRLLASPVNSCQEEQRSSCLLIRIPYFLVTSLLAKRELARGLKRSPNKNFALFFCEIRNSRDLFPLKSLSEAKSPFKTLAKEKENLFVILIKKKRKEYLNFFNSLKT